MTIMKKASLIIALLLFVFALQAQKNTFDKAMKNALAEMSICESAKDFAKAAAGFEKIAISHPEEWLPAYYVSLNYIEAANKAEESGDTDAFLDKAQEQLDKMKTEHPEEAELTVLQAFTYLARIQVDPMSRGRDFLHEGFYVAGKSLKAKRN
jgi:hypothetical protein